MGKALELHKGDLVTPSIEFLGHGHIFTVTEVDIEKRKCYIELFEENARLGKCEFSPQSCKKLTWGYLELDLIRTIESMDREWYARPDKNLNQIKEATAKMYMNGKELPGIFASRQMDSTYLTDFPPELFVKDNEGIKACQINIKEREEDMYKILELYKMKEMDIIKEKHQEMRKSIIEIDEIQLIIKEMENQVKVIAGEKANAYSFEYRGLYEDRTKKALEEIDIAENAIILDLNKKIEQIQALLELAPNYEEKIKILRDYEIMDKKKNIIL